MSDGTPLQPVLDKALREALPQCRVPGIAAALRLGGTLLWSGGAGSIDLEHTRPPTGTDRFCLYSITKTLTAICILTLVEKGLMRLDAPAVLYRPELPIPGTITVTHLLQHTSGIGDYGALPEYKSDVRHHPSDPWSVDRFLAGVPPERLAFAPGAGWSYSNIGFMLLRLIIEAVTGRSYRDCVAEYVAAPLDLRDTFVADCIDDWQSCVPGYGTEVSSDGSFALSQTSFGTAVRGGKRPLRTSCAGGSRCDVRPVYHPGWCAPGVAVSTAVETTAIYDGLFSSRFFSTRFARTLPPLVRVPGQHPPHVAPSAWLGLLADPQNPHGPLFFHGGGGPGYSLSAMILPRFPAGHLSLAVFANASDGEDVELAGRALLDAAVAALKKQNTP